MVLSSSSFGGPLDTIIKAAQTAYSAATRSSAVDEETARYNAGQAAASRAAGEASAVASRTAGPGPAALPTASAGVPTWLWIGLGVAAVGGGAFYFLRKR